MILSFNIDKSPYNTALIELDFDPAAERYGIIDRNSLSMLWIGPVSATNPAKVVVPLQYTTNNNLAIMIFDDAGTPNYNAAINDKVRAQLVDARTITTNP